MVGVAGFEPATPASRTRCATRLRYTPMAGPWATLYRRWAEDPQGRRPNRAPPKDEAQGGYSRSPRPSLAKPPKPRQAAQVSPSPRDLARDCPTAGAEHDLRKVGTGFCQKIMLKQKSEKRCRDSISRGSVLEACWIGELTLSPVAQAMRGGGEQHSDWGVAKR
jgi:hypothetical protein